MESSDQQMRSVADTRGKHRISAELKQLEQEARFLEEELEQVDRMEKASAVCKDFPGDSLCNPSQTIIQTIAGEGRAGLDMPIMVLNAVKGEGISDLRRGHGIFKILFVSVYEHDSSLQIIMREQLEQFVLHSGDPGSVSAVYNYNNSMSSTTINDIASSTSLPKTQNTRE
nr:guanine nucleotide-binding protein subunit gamma 2-like [Ipomoea batatas]